MTCVVSSWEYRNVNNRKIFLALLQISACHALNLYNCQESGYLYKDRKKILRRRTSRNLLDLGCPERFPLDTLRKSSQGYHWKQTICFIHRGSLIQKCNRLTSIFQMFRLESRSQQKVPSLSTPLNPKPAALFTASAMVFKTTHSDMEQKSHCCFKRY